MDTILLCVVPLACYILHSLGLHRISRRRRLPHAWVSWLPVINIFQLGTVADHDRLARKGKKGLLRWGLSLSFVICCVGVFMALAAIAEVLLGVLAGAVTVGLLLLSEEYVTGMAELSAQASSVASVSLLLCILFFVVNTVARYRIYRSCHPSGAGVYLLLSIFLPFLRPVLLFLLRNKDDAAVYCPADTGTALTEPQ